MEGSMNIDLASVVMGGAAVVIGKAIWQNYAAGYLGQKGKNKADKEDI